MTNNNQLSPPARELSVDETVGRNAHQLLFAKKARQNQLAAAMGLTPSVLGKKLHGESGWSAWQVKAAADFLDVEVCRLFDEPEERLYAHRGAGDHAKVTDQRITPKLAAITSNVDVTPRRVGHLQLVTSPTV